MVVEKSVSARRASYTPPFAERRPWRAVATKVLRLKYGREVIAVAFVFEGVLGSEEGLGRAAFLRVADAALRERGRVFHESVAARALERAPDAAAAFQDLCGPSAPLPELLAHYRETVAALAPEFVRPQPGAARVLTELRRLAIPHAMVGAAPLEVARCRAEWIGFEGPVLAASDELARTLSLPLERIYFVGADPLRDVEPAREAGMQTVWLGRGASYPPGLPAPAFVIASIGELLDLLRGPYTRSLLGLRYVLNSVTTPPRAGARSNGPACESGPT